MKITNNIYLEASHSGNKLQIGLRTQGDAVWNYEYVLISLDNIQNSCQSIIEIMNKTSRRGANSQTLSSLKKKGTQLCDLLIPTDFKEFLRNSNAKHLLIYIDDHLVQIPWELLCVGDQFFCERFSMGRSVKIKQKLKTNIERVLTKPITLWIICNPDKDLEKPGWEVTEICKQIDITNKQYGRKIEASLDVEQSPDDVKTSIKEYDFVHYAGHGDYNSTSPGKSGWRLLDGIFMGNDIEQISGGTPMPALVFSNACQSTRTEKWENNEFTNKGSFGLANSFMRSGVKHYIGPFWDIPDEPASEFSIQFYKYLIMGNSVGNAIKKTRIEMLNNNKCDVSWASYILYGDPTVNYLQTNEEESFHNNQYKTRSQKAFEQTNKNLSESSNSKFSIISYLKWFILLCILANISYLGYITLSDKNDISPDHIYKLMEIEKEKDDKIDQLMNEINARIDKSSFKFKQITKDDWTCQPLRISIVVGETFNFFINQGLCFDVASAIESELLKVSRVKVLDRLELKTILREYKLILSNLVKDNERLQPDLLPVDLFLDIRVRIIQPKKSNKYIVVIRLKRQTTEIIYKNEEPLDINKHIYGVQKQRLAKDLIKFINDNYPLSGKIIEINNDFVSLNIGHKVGVKKNYLFCNEDNKITVRIEEVFRNKSNAVIEKGNIVPIIGAKFHHCFVNED